jgi:type IV secretory pathway VirB3-like protein
MYAGATTALTIMTTFAKVISSLAKHHPDQLLLLDIIILIIEVLDDNNMRMIMINKIHMYSKQNSPTAEIYSASTISTIILTWNKVGIYFGQYPGISYSQQQKKYLISTRTCASLQRTDTLQRISLLITELPW